MPHSHENCAEMWHDVKIQIVFFNDFCADWKLNISWLQIYKRKSKISQDVV